ncbi:NAD(P)H-hydrate dehydratase [Lacticaseibacillus jixiensis]|uniref:NAD(P)H-hydrate dehydratase n=1 Tax=Lacticaseibacillus jixiensis TaxID=3231926 RepID=UPI0036F41F7A
MQAIDEALVRQVIKVRNVESHKGNYGRVLIVGGNPQYGGAAILSASAAVYAGAGLVSVATAAVNRSALHARLPEAMILPYDDPGFAALVASQDVVVVGPGLGVDQTAQAVLTQTFAAVLPTQTLVIDGSAITLVAQLHPELPKAHLIWTPHQMEWQRLSGVAIAQQTPAANQAAAAALAGWVIVKSHRTEVFTDAGAFVNTTGSAAMATGGSGDTLTGILAAFVGQFGLRPQTVCAAVYTHSAVADELAASQYVALPSHVIAALPNFMARMAQA